MNLYTEAKEIAEWAWEEAKGDYDLAQEFINDRCNDHEVSIYYSKAIKFCSEQDTSSGELLLEDCGGIAYPGDTFGMIACRIACTTLACAALDFLFDLEQDSAA